MRQCFIICFVLLMGCSKKPAPAEAPKCRLTTITRFGYAYPLTYDGLKIVKVGDDPSTNSLLNYDNAGRLTTIEMPSKNPVYKTELFYNDEGKISIEKNYEKYGDNWREITNFFFTYTNSKLTSIKETAQFAVPALEFDHEVIWDGNNIRSIITQSGSTVVCTRQYSYDSTRKNPMTPFISLYYGDNLKPSYKMALYYSANQLIKEDNTCPSAQTTNITYDLSDSLHLKLFANGSEYLTFNYECR